MAAEPSWGTTGKLIGAMSSVLCPLAKGQVVPKKHPSLSHVPFSGPKACILEHGVNRIHQCARQALAASGGALWTLTGEF